MSRMMQNIILASIIVLLIHSLDAQLVINTEDPATLSESVAKVGTVVFNFTVTATPQSSCDFTYEVDTPEIFNVTGSGGANSNGQGTVTLNKELDYEERGYYTVTLKATEQCDASMTIEKMLTIILEDTNDNAPYYDTSLITAINKIENDDNLFVTQLKAKDSDGTYEFNTNSIQFSFQGNYDGVLDLKNNGIIIDGWATVDLYLSVPLDYEKGQCYQVHVIAEDCKGQQCDSVQSSTAVVSFAVTDVDDQLPIFTQYTQYVEIPENSAVGKSVTTVKAVDGDYGLNQAIRYTFQDDSEWYQIDPVSGEITVQKSPDREGEGYEQAGTALIIKATEVGNEESTATATVTIHLSDANDVAPTFSQLTYIGTVIESATFGFPVTLDNLIQVSDNDEEANAGFTVSIKEPDVPFQLTANEGVGTYWFAIVVNAPLDYKTQPSYTLTVEAADKKDDTLKSYSTVIVSVTEDDKAVRMILDGSSECFAVPENSPKGYEVCKFKVIYSNDTINSTNIKYTAISGSSAKGLKLDKLTGIVTIDDPTIFDYESGKTFDVIIEAVDFGKRATFALSGNITDKNDNSPSFSASSGEGMIFNGANDFDSPFIVQAMDADNGVNGIVNYRLVANGNEKYFKIQPHTQSGESFGLISPVNTINLASIGACNGHEDVCKLELLVEAYDSGSPVNKRSMTVTAKIMNCYCFKTSSATTHNIGVELLFIVVIYVLRMLM